jgi:hypothetical protein
MLDFLEWIGPEPRLYADVIEAWRTSCPRRPVWEDAKDRGFVARHRWSVQPRMTLSQPARGLPGGGVLEQSAVLAVATHELHPDRQS